MRMANRAIGLFLLAGLALAGCSHNNASPAGPMSAVSNNVRIQVTTSPSPPQPGSNVITVHATDATTGAPIVNANVLIATRNTLAGGGDSQTGRSQGNGDYQAPVRLPIPDSYDLTVTVQRTGKDDAVGKFPLTAQ